MSLAVPSDFEEMFFTFGFCADCDREVLTHPDFEAAQPRMLCVHCDAVVATELRSTSGAELPDRGYGLLELQGCGNPECGGGACSRLRDGATGEPE